MSKTCDNYVMRLCDVIKYFTLILLQFEIICVFGHPVRTYMSTWFCYAKLGAINQYQSQVDCRKINLVRNGCFQDHIIFILLPLIYYKNFAYILSFICCKNYLILILNVFNLIDGLHQVDSPQAYHCDANKEDEVHAWQSCSPTPS